MDKIKRWALVLSAALSVMMFSVFAFAESETANAVLISSAQDTADMIKANMNGVLPIALGVMGLSLAITIGIGFFKRITKKSGS